MISTVQADSRTAPAVDLRPLAGVRAVCSALVVCFHCWLIWCFMVPYEQQAQLTRHHWAAGLLSRGGPVAVDVFLILTGMLAAYQLLPNLEHCGGASCWAVAANYWRRRAARVLPAYVVTNALVALGLGSPSVQLPSETRLARDFAFGSCQRPGSLWNNLTLMSNARWADSCGLHLWSMSLQASHPCARDARRAPLACSEVGPSSPCTLTHFPSTPLLQIQFWAVFPLLLLALRPRAAGFRTRLAAALAAIVAGGSAWRVWRVATTPDMHLPYGDMAQHSELAAYVGLLDATYFPTGTRIAELAIGVALGTLLRTPTALQWLADRRGGVTAAAVALQAVYVHLCMHWNLIAMPGELPWAASATTLYASLCYYGSPFLALLVSATLLHLVLPGSSDPVHSRVAAVLASPTLLPIASVSYCLYLMHELARFWAMRLLLPAGALPALVGAAPITSLLAFAAGTLAAGYAVASALHHLVEKRF